MPWFFKNVFHGENAALHQTDGRVHRVIPLTSGFVEANTERPDPLGALYLLVFSSASITHQLVRN